MFHQGRHGADDETAEEVHTESAYREIPGGRVMEREAAKFVAGNRTDRPAEGDHEKLFDSEHKLHAPQDRHWRKPDEQHRDLHYDSRNDERLVPLDPGEAGADDSFYRHVHKGWTRRVTLPRTASRHGIELCVDRPRTKCGDHHSLLAHFGADSFGKTSDVGFARCI